MSNHEEAASDWLDDACLSVADGQDPDILNLSTQESDALAMLREIAGLSKVFAAGMCRDEGAALPFDWGRLNVLSRIGQGSFGVVYRAYDPDLDRYVALKLIGSRQATDPQSLITEARRHAQVRHPNILAIHGASVEDGQAGFWMDLLTGQTLEQRVKTGPPLTTSELIRLFRDLTQALQAITEQSLLHGDLKATNVWMNESGRAVVMDFGAAAPASDDAPRFGSPATMAPELFAGDPATMASEVFSLGATLCFAATGDYPAPGSSFADIRRAYLANRSVDASVLGRIPNGIRPLIRDCLRTSPRMRPTLQGVMDELDDIEIRPARRFRRIMVSALVASLTAGLAISLILLDRSRNARVAAENARVEAQTSKDFLVDAVRDFSPISGAGFSEISEVLDFLGEFADERLASTPVARGELKVVVGTRQSHFGEVEAGLKLAYEGLDELRTALGEEETHRIELVRALNTLADEERRLGNPVEAEPLAREALEIVEDLVDGSEELALTRIRIRGLYSNVLEELGRWQEALTTQEAIFKDRASLVGIDDPRMAVEHNNLAARYSYLGSHEDALQHYRKALELLLADETLRRYPFALVSHSIAAELTFMGRFAEAEEAITTAIDAYNDLDFGDDSEQVLLVETLRATRYRAEGDFESALAIYRRVIDKDAMSGAPKRNTFASMGRTFLLAGQNKDALASYREAMGTDRPEGHPSTQHLNAALAVASFRAGQGTRETALRAIQEAADLYIGNGYTGTFEYQDLWRWGQSLGLDLPAVEAQRAILPPL